MPQIAHFQVEKWKSSLPWEGGHPPPPGPLSRGVDPGGGGGQGGSRLPPMKILGGKHISFGQNDMFAPQ